MNQRTHSWIAIRAVALLEDEGEEENLVTLLKPLARAASVGAWIPDQGDAKRGDATAATNNHIFKIKPYTRDDQKERFITRKAELLGLLGAHSMTARFLREDISLDDNWWSKPYRGDVDKPGQHLPNRAMALSTMMKDLLLMGNETVDHLIPGNIRFAQYMIKDTRTEEEAAAMYFFMLSHFIADACMPCHCDGRKLSLYDTGLHMEMEKHWSRKVGTAFEKKKLLPKDLRDHPERIGDDADAILEQARKIDTKFDLHFENTPVPDLMPKQDVWLTVINQCRASFAVASIIAPYRQYSYNNPDARAPFETVLDTGDRKLLKKVNHLVMHDAVLNTAIIWKHIWNKVSKE